LFVLHALTRETKQQSGATRPNAGFRVEGDLHPPARDSAFLQPSQSAAGAVATHGTRGDLQRKTAAMQRSLGNQAVVHMLDSSLQSHHTAPFDAVSPGVLQRKCACDGSGDSDGECAECKEASDGALQRWAAQRESASAVPPIIHEVLRSSGQPLDAPTRAFFEPRFGRDFSEVRIHTDARAAESARVVSALAYTVGRDVVFAPGMYAPADRDGRQLLAHELSHVLQQNAKNRLQRGGLETGLRRKLAGCPQDAQEEPDHSGTCPEIDRERDELERYSMTGATLATIAPNECYLLWNFASGGSEFRAPGLNDVADLLWIDPTLTLLVTGYSDCKGSAALNAGLRINRASVMKDHFVKELGVDRERIVVETVPATQYVTTNLTSEGRARNRSVAIQVLSPGLPERKRAEEIPERCRPRYETTFGPSNANCDQYRSSLAKGFLSWTYRHNAICACENTPNDVPNNCVRKCLQVKLVSFLSGLNAGGAVQGTCLDTIGILDPLCPEPYCSDLYAHHEECYRECCCDREFIGYPAFLAMCEVPVFPCSLVGATIRWFNSCMAGAGGEVLDRVPQVYGTIQKIRRGHVETGEESVTYNPESGAVISRRKK